MWKCHKETPCVSILNKQKCHFFSFTKSENRKMEKVLSGGIIPVGVGGCGERLWKGEYCVHMYVSGKMRPVKTIPGMGEGKTIDGGNEFKYDICDRL
jgi:hypothetical protein